MFRVRMISAALVVLSFWLAPAQQSAFGQSTTPPAFAVASPVDLRIAAAQKKVKAAPGAQSYNDLAFALCRKGRDTGEPAVFEQAAAALARSAALEPGNYESQKLQAALYLETQQYTKALKLATELNRKVPDDIVNWGLLVDANMALGNYAEAERDAQWILDLRPGSALGFEKAAALREVFGDFTGSIEFYNEANLRASPNDADQRGWYLTRKAQLELASGSIRLAEEAIKQAELLFPDSNFARSTLAAIRSAEGRYDEAASLVEINYKKVPSASNLYAWAEVVEKSSHPDGSTALFQQFEVKAQAERNRTGCADINLIFFYLNQRRDPVKALSLAEARSAEYHDCATLDALAWTLYSNGRYSEAKAQLDRALAVGIRNPVYFCHAAQIAAKLNDEAAAQMYRKELADLGSNTCPGERVMNVSGAGK
ncbi:MAG: tetratricopeptide repeat protein [Acidobacteriaceae bacterium]|nr:tetratricopeptide repeat protein [Acidobacteriaceae bacterium]